MTMPALNGKRILMFSPFGTCKHYTDSIVTELRRNGATVKVFDERPSQKALAKIYMTLFYKYAPSYFKRYIKGIAEQNLDFNPDIIFIIRGQGFDENILQYLREVYPKAKFIYFQWDPLCGKQIPHILKLYDRAFSFDEDDVKNNPEFIFRPTFFIHDYTEIAGCRDFKYDTSFVGTLYYNRWPIINNLRNYLNRHNIRAFFYLYMASWTLYLWDFIRRGIFVNPHEMGFKMMSYKDNIEIVKQSRSILDIVYSKQAGLSMRAYEALASKRKYLTNNKNIVNYPFYDKDNILLIDPANPNIPKDFFSRPFKEIPSDIIQKYSVEGFVRDIFKDIS